MDTGLQLYLKPNSYYLFQNQFCGAVYWHVRRVLYAKVAESSTFTVALVRTVSISEKRQLYFHGPNLSAIKYNIILLLSSTYTAIQWNLHFYGSAVLKTIQFFCEEKPTTFFTKQLER